MPSAIDRKVLRAAPVEIRVLDTTPAEISQLGQPAGFFKPEGSDFVFRSALGEGHGISEHMVWLHGMLQFDHKRFRQALADGRHMVVRVYLESREVALSPQAILLAHKLQLPIEIVFLR
jgi:hypothetical protein